MKLRAALTVIHFLTYVALIEVKRLHRARFSSLSEDKREDVTRFAITREELPVDPARLPYLIVTSHAPLALIAFLSRYKTRASFRNLFILRSGQMFN